MGNTEEQLRQEIQNLKIRYPLLFLKAFGVFSGLFVIVQAVDFFGVISYQIKTTRVFAAIILLSCIWFALAIIMQKTRAHRRIKDIAVALLAEWKLVSERHKAIILQFESTSKENDGLRQEIGAVERDMKMLQFVASQHLLLLGRLNLGQLFEREVKELKRLYGVEENGEER